MQLFKTPLSFLFICACLLVHAKAAPVSQDSSIHLDRRDLSFGSLVPRAERRQDKPPAAGKQTPPTAGGNGNSTYPPGEAQSPTGKAATDDKGSASSKPSTWWTKWRSPKEPPTARKTLKKAIKAEKYKAYKLSFDELASQHGTKGSVGETASKEAANLLWIPGNTSARQAYRMGYEYHRAKMDEIMESGDLKRLDEIENHARMASMHRRKSNGRS